MPLLVGEADKRECMDMVVKHHYSHRKVGIKFCFGLFSSGVLVGCCIFSVPASYTLCNGVCGVEYRKNVIELSRLVVIAGDRNAASFLIGGAFRLLKSKGNWVIVSYADCNDHVGHVGYVYQATNWIYTGKGTAEPIWTTKEGEVVSYTRRHIDRKAEALGMHWTELKRKKQSGKHRYVYFCGDKRFCRNARRALKYPVIPFPKGSTRRHELLTQQNNQLP